MPTNLYGPHDNFDLETSHVLPALMRKFHEAKVSGAETVTVWGSGTPYREFLHVDDLAEASLFLMSLPDDLFQDLLFPGPAVPVPGPPALINVGSGEEVTIRELALLVGDTVGFSGELVFDATKPDGTPRKLSDVSRLHALGWKHRTALREGLAEVYTLVQGERAMRILVTAGQDISAVMWCGSSARRGTRWWSSTISPPGHPPH